MWLLCSVASHQRGVYAAASIWTREVILTTFAFICFAILRYDYLHDFLLSISNQNQNTPVFLWRRWDSNSRPPACKADVLPTELQPHLRKVKDSNLRYISVCHVSNVVLSVTQPTFLFVAVVEPASHLWVMSPPCDCHTATAILAYCLSQVFGLCINLIYIRMNSLSMSVQRYYKILNIPNL